MQRRATVLVAATAAFCMAGSAWGQLQIQSVSQNASTVGLYELFEVQFDLNQNYNNEFDPDEIDVTMTFTGPSSVQRVIPCYWTDQSPAWRARITPLETGAHTCVITAVDNQSRSDTHTVYFTATTSTSKGYVGLDSRNVYYMQFSDGTPYIPIGHNLCWQFEDANYDDYLDNMGAHGENWSRLWACSFGQGIEWGHNKEPQFAGLGTYSQDVCERLEWMLDYALDNGVYYQLCMDTFTAWNHDWFAGWDENPYNTANGGTLGAPIGVFTDTTAKKLYKQRYRYFVARFAWHPGVLAWEFWNEADAIGSGGPYNLSYWANRTAAANWHAEMGAYIKSIDPYDHLTTTSYVYPFKDQDMFPEVNGLPEIDIVNLHQYDINVPVSHANMIIAARAFNKPIIFGEGNMSSNSGDQASWDPGGGTISTQNWAGVCLQGGTVMSWWWDGYIHPGNMYWRYDGVSNFAAGEDWAPKGMVPATVTRLGGPTNMDYYGSAASDYAILFIHNQSGSQVFDLSIDLPQVTLDTVKAEWYNTGNGSVIQTDTVTRQNGVLTLSAPPIADHIALKVKPFATTPLISLSASTLSPTVEEGNNAAADTFTVANSGINTLNYTVSDNASWISVSPSSGTSTGEADTITVTYSTSGLSAGSYNGTITVSDPNAANNPKTIAVALTVTAPVVPLTLTNADFSNGLTGWTQWTERGTITFADSSGRGHVSGNNINGGLWQQFNTGGYGSQVDIDGWWATSPTTANNQWVEVLIINGSRTPSNGSDVNAGQSDVEMIYKNDTWATPAGWSGNMDVTAAVTNVGTFTAADSVATLVLKIGNGGGSVNGALFDNIALSTSGGTPTPTIALSTSTLSPSCNVGSNPANGSFTVSNSGTGTLSYSISDNASWMSVSPSTGTSTGEADAITVSYSASSLSAGTYNGTITVSDPNATNNSQTIAVTLTVSATGPTTVVQDYETMPSWSSTFDASWGSAASWNIGGGGQSGNALELSRSSQGSSARVKVYTIDANTSYTISIYIRCPSYAGTYWAECAYKLGSNTASDFDNNGGTWTMIKKFDNSTNGNGDTWTQYSVNFNSGSNTQISVGHKLGSSGGAGPTIRFDTLRVN